jgi:hypothetical protein
VASKTRKGGNAIEMTKAEFQAALDKAKADALESVGLKPAKTYYAIPEGLYWKLKAAILFDLDDSGQKVESFTADDFMAWDRATKLGHDLATITAEV